MSETKSITTEREIVEQLTNILLFNDSKEATDALLDSVQIRQLIPLEELQNWSGIESKTLMVEELERLLLNSGVSTLDSKRIALRMSDISERQRKALFNCLYSTEIDFFALSRELIRSVSMLGRQLDCMTLEMGELVWELIQSKFITADNNFNESDELKVLCKGEIAFTYALIGAMQSNMRFEGGRSAARDDYARRIMDISGVRVDFPDSKEIAETIAFRADEFDVGVIALPWGVRLRSDTQDSRDEKYPNLSSEVALLKQSINRVKGLLICIVPESFLTKTSGDDFRLKTELIENGLLTDVVQLPERILKWSSAAPSLLIINKGQQQKSVRLVSAAQDKFIEKDEWGNPVLTDLHSIDSGMKFDKNTGLSQSVSLEQIRGQRFNLLPEKYLKTSRLNATIDIFFEKSERIELLKDLATVIGCQALTIRSKNVADTEKDDKETVSVLGPSAIDEYGFHINSSELRKISPDQKLESRIEKQKLKKGDVLLCIKGPVGKCVYIAESPPESIVANQAFVILRTTKFSPKVLFLYLISQVGQALLKASTHGTGVPILKTSDLRYISVPVPTVEFQEMIEESFSKIADLIDEKRILQVEIEKTIDEFWPGSDKG